MNMKSVAWIGLVSLALAAVACDDDGGSGGVDAATYLDGGGDAFIKLDGPPGTGGSDGGGDANGDGGGIDGMNSSGDAGTDAGGDAGEMMTSQQCSTYCDTVTANCTSTNAQYLTKGNCVSTCQTRLAWPAGSGTADQNTLACRSYHAGLAATDPAVHCMHAGVTGGGVCGSLCENYCYIMSKFCPTAYASLSLCESACAQFPTGGQPKDVTGNTLYCRVNHAVAAGVDATVHCPNAGAMNSPACQ